MEVVLDSKDGSHTAGITTGSGTERGATRARARRQESHTDDQAAGTSYFSRLTSHFSLLTSHLAGDQPLAQRQADERLMQRGAGPRRALAGDGLHVGKK